MDITHKIQVINVGLEFFRDELERQEIPVVHLDWHPPAQGNSAVLQLKSLEAFAKAADGQATKIIIPSEIQGLAGMVKAVTEVAKEG